MSACVTNPCGEDLLQTARSPDGLADATVTVSDCGATTHFYTVVEIHAANQSERHNDKDRVFWTQGRAPLHLSWIDDHTLQVSADSLGPQTKILRMARSKEGYKIVYSWSPTKTEGETP